MGEDGAKYTPVLLHRAALGSFERFIGILLENYEGKLPFWLAPTQVVLAAITDDANEYTVNLNNTLVNEGIRSELDIRNEQISYKVREHSLQKIPYIVAIGKKEINDKKELELRDNFKIYWKDNPIAKIKKGKNYLSPEIEIIF